MPNIDGLLYKCWAPVATDRIGKACTDSYRHELALCRKSAPDADRVGHHTEMAWDTQPGQTSIYTMCIQPLQLDSRSAHYVRPPICRDMTGKQPDILQAFREAHETFACPTASDFAQCDGYNL